MKKTQFALLDPTHFEIQGYLEIGNKLLIQACTKGTTANCPNCGSRSSSVHSYYERQPRDLPLFDRFVVLKLRVRRFRCREQSCRQQTFVERLGLVGKYQQRTRRYTNSLRAIGFSLGGAAGAALLPAIHMRSSDDTLLRLVKKTPMSHYPTPKVLGVDDWAQCRGRRYGTILVDLETRQPVDLLPDRTSEALADWLEQHPGVQIVTRDRSTEYARGIMLGAPTATQVADRWHLLLNWRQMVERWLRRIHRRLRKLPLADALAVALGRGRHNPFPRTARESEASKASRRRRLARYRRIQKLKKSGKSILQISRQLRLHRETVRTFYYAESFPERSIGRIRDTILDPYLTYLRSRVAEGCENGAQLWREVQARGYSGSYQQVSRWLRQRRTKVAAQAKDTKQRQLPNAKVTPRLPGAKELTRLLLRNPDALAADEQLWVKHICQDGKVQQLYLLAQRYLTMVRERQAANLAQWMRDATATAIPTILGFVKGIRLDYDAVLAALEFPWTNGQVEGQVNRLKLLKRQMYGRASFDLLRARVLYRPPLHES